MPPRCSRDARRQRSRLNAEQRRSADAVLPAGSGKRVLRTTDRIIAIECVDGWHRSHS